MGSTCSPIASGEGAALGLCATWQGGPPSPVGSTCWTDSIAGQGARRNGNVAWQGGPIGQHRVAQAAAIDRAIIAQQVVAKAVGNGVRLGRPGRVERVHQPVGVDIFGAESLSKQLADRALAAGDIARQSEKKNHVGGFCYTFTR